MPDEAVKQRNRYDKEKAKKELFHDGYKIIECDNKILCLLATKEPFYERKIRIVSDEIKENDVEIMRRCGVIPNQSKEIWCSIKGFSYFKKIEVKDSEIMIVSDPCQTQKP